MTNIRPHSGTTAVLNRFSEHFTTYVFRDHDQDHALLLDLVNAAFDDEQAPAIKGRFVSFVPDPSLTEKFFERERSWIVVGEGTTDRNEQATVVLQFFKHPTFELTYFVADCGDLQFTRDQDKRSEELARLSPDRPLVFISLFRQARCRHDPGPDWHQIMESTWRHHAQTVQIAHFVNGRKMDEQRDALPQNRLRMWMDFFCRREEALFMERSAGDPLFDRMLALEKRFSADPRLMDEYRKTEEESAALERLMNVWHDPRASA